MSDSQFDSSSWFDAMVPGTALSTLVDQGGPSVLTFPGFREYIAKPAASRVLAEERKHLLLTNQP